jgi:putative sterol carrier protein
MTISELKSLLEANFQPAAAADFNATLAISAGGESLTLTVNGNALTFPDQAEPDATFIFPDVDAAWHLISGKTNPIDAFMAGEFRSDGFLLWGFRLLGMFASP